MSRYLAFLVLPSLLAGCAKDDGAHGGAGGKLSLTDVDGGSGGQAGKPSVDPSEPTPLGCDALCDTGTCFGEICAIKTNEDVTSSQQEQLSAGGEPDASFEWLYPYDGTVFPRGLAAPTLQLGGAPADAVYVHITTRYFEYRGFFGKRNPVRVELSREVWKSLNSAVRAGESVEVEVTKLALGKVMGPSRASWTIAPGSLRGSVYFDVFPRLNTSGGDPTPAAIWRLRSTDGALERVLLGNVSPVVSADGTTLLASTYPYGTSSSYDLRGGLRLKNEIEEDCKFGQAALVANGALALASYRPECARIFAQLSLLYDTGTRVHLSADGWDGLRGALQPRFSADDRHVVFFSAPATPPPLQPDRVEAKEQEETTGRLMVADFDPGTRAFSSVRELAPAEDHLDSPAFTPDGARVVAVLAQDLAYFSPRDRGPLVAIDVESGQRVELARLNGPSGTSVSSQPSVLPVAVGGYFWLVFESARDYGNLLRGQLGQGKLWAAALDLDFVPGKDPSHPPFILPGQDLADISGAPSWVLDPCRSNGASCGGGDECCTGFCRDVGTGPVCIPKPDGCAQTLEACQTSDDCCSAGSRCINQHCAPGAPQ